MFALGQLYVLWSRVTDPTLFHAVGLPPADLLDDVAKAWAGAGLDVNVCFRAAVDVTGERSYTDAPTGVDPCVSVRSRLKQVRQEEARVKLQLFTLTEILNPQPRAADVVHALLAWVDAADRASQEHREAPPFEREDGSPIFPEGEEWWLTEISKRRMPDSSKDLANDDIAAGNLTDNPSEAGLSSNESGIDQKRLLWHGRRSASYPSCPQALVRLQNESLAQICNARGQEGVHHASKRSKSRIRDAQQCDDRTTTAFDQEDSRAWRSANKSSGT